MSGSAVHAGKRATYSAYKPSGIKWVGDVPEHWEVHRLKHIASVQFSSVDKHTKEGEESVRLCNYVDVYYNDFIREGIEFMAATATRSEIERFQLRHGDVLITKDSEAWDDIAVPAYVAEELNSVLCGYHLAHIRPDLRKVLGEYLFRAFRSRGVNDQFRVAANGITRFGLGKYWLDNGLFPVPPLDEQKAIAAFLDRETARIDALIEKKQRQIELLQEKRSALISHAITKGLDPNAPMKDSGIDWLGKVPKHWEVKQLKRAVMFQRGHDLPQQDRLPGEVPLVTSAGVSAWHNEAAAKGPGIVTGRYGTIGHFHLVEHDYWPLNTTLYSTTVHGNNTRFVWYMLHLLTPVFMVEAGKSAVPGVDRNDLHPIPVCVPPVTEQADIVRELDRETAQIDQLAARVEGSIKMLQEHRTALIAAAVTGKIDVRGEVA